jgi:hypothetical protein
MRVKVAGLVAQTGPGATRLLGALRGMCSRYRSRTAHELVLRAPLGGGAGAQPLRLVGVLPADAATAGPATSKLPPSAPSWWALRHESAALRGPAYAALPAAVREVAETRMHTPTGGGGGGGGGSGGAGGGGGGYAVAPGFVAALGAAVEAAVERRGNVYRCSHAGLPVDVEVSILSPLPAGAAEELGRSGLVDVASAASASAEGGGAAGAGGAAAAAAGAKKQPSSYTRGYYLVEAHITVAETMASQAGGGGAGGAAAAAIGGGADAAEGLFWGTTAPASAEAAAAAAAAAAGSLGEGAPLPLLPPGGHIEAAWALGAFAEKLLPMVRLQPAL